MNLLLMKKESIYEKKLACFAILVLSLFVLPTIILGWGVLVLTDYDFVDSGKHMDYVNESSYPVVAGINVWNNYKPGVIRADAWNTVNDVTYQDVASIAPGVTGRTYPDGVIKFAKNYMDNYQYSYRLNACIHETGHGLRLGHRDETDSVMQENVTNITTLSRGDQLNYDYAYDNYY